MKVLLDTCVWGGAKQILEAAGYDVIWSGDWPSDPGDEEILAQAYREDRVLVTLDKDFGEKDSASARQTNRLNKNSSRSGTDLRHG